MRHVRLSLSVPPEDRHPMHQFAIEHGGYSAYWQLHWQGRPAEGMTILFYVEGPVEPYLAALEDHAADASHSVTEAAGDGFYLYAHSELRNVDRGLAGAVDRPGVVLVPPLEYRMDGTMAASLVGPAKELSTAVEAIPETFDPDVLALQPYAQRSFQAAGELTERQREVVAAAVDAGYYEGPSEATIEEVASTLGCASSTAAEHLRKAEAAVMKRAATGPVGTAAIEQPPGSGR